MLTLAVVARLLAASQVVLTAVAVAGSPSPLRLRAIVVALALGIVAYLVLPIVLMESRSAGLRLPLTLSASAIPVLAYLLSRELFDDTPRSWAVPGLVASAYLALHIVGDFLFEGFSTVREAALFTSERVVFDVVPQLAKLGFALAAIVVSLRGRDADLIEARRIVRRWFAIGLALIVSFVLITELATRWVVPAPIEAAGMTGLLLAALIVNLAFIRLNPPFALGERAMPRAAPPVVTDPVLTELLRLMESERLYAQHGLRIADAAARLRVSEHRLRRLINGTLGHRNFNEFVNNYRIREASVRLVTERLPVLSIALDVGFRSLSSFNQAFRTAQGTTPSEFRERSAETSRGPESEIL